MNAVVMFIFVIQHRTISNRPANTTWDVLFVFHLVITAVLLHMKKCNVLHNGFITETTAKDGWKFKKRRKGQFHQSYVLASLTHKSSPKPADIQITAGNYEGEDLN